MRTKIVVQEGAEKSLQRLAREQMKHKLLADILIDMTICKIEGRDIGEYINDLKNMIDKIIEKHKILKG